MTKGLEFLFYEDRLRVLVLFNLEKAPVSAIGLCLFPVEEETCAVPGAGPQGPPGSRAAAPGPLECRRCRYLCTARACCQVVGALLAALLLVCGSVSYGSTGGYTGVASLGGIHYYQYGGAYSGFSGADGEKARQLDQRFHLLKLPIARAAMAVGGSLTVFSCLLILFGVLRVPWHFPAWLLLECTLDAVVGIGLVPALYYFFHYLLEVYNSSVCKEREQLYQSKGYQGFRCSLHGAEIAAGLLGCTAVMAYLLSAGLAVKGYRTVRKLKQKPVQVYEL
ncbi:MARVEL domain-containing protein 3 [Aythya fuligula]|uniref:MARVEL domain-containing protein 3 n=1 Tax=Aythya fuligula TaxID=219594 RepID=A0A6J3DQ77_AYTFU|nr:MARVEL domain-containing protein 3 [Aythya fuligula]